MSKLIYLFVAVGTVAIAVGVAMWFMPPTTTANGDSVKCSGANAVHYDLNNATYADPALDDAEATCNKATSDRRNNAKIALIPGVIFAAVGGAMFVVERRSQRAHVPA